MNDIESSLPAEAGAKEAAIDQAILDRTAKFLSTHTVELSLPEDVSRSFDEGEQQSEMKYLLDHSSYHDLSIHFDSSPRKEEEDRQVSAADPAAAQTEGRRSDTDRVGRPCPARAQGARDRQDRVDHQRHHRSPEAVRQQASELRGGRPPCTLVRAGRPPRLGEIVGLRSRVQGVQTLRIV